VLMFTTSYLWECSCLPPVMCGSAHVYHQLFVGVLMFTPSYVWECSCLPPVMCGSAHVYPQLFVGVLMFTPQLFVGVLMAYLWYLCLLVHSGVQYVLTIWVTRRVSYKRQGTAYTSRVPKFTPGVMSVLFICLVFCDMFLCFYVFFCLRSVSCITSVYELFILDCPFCFL